MPLTPDANLWFRQPSLLCTNFESDSLLNQFFGLNIAHAMDTRDTITFS